MLNQELEMGVLDLYDGKRKIIKLRKEEICMQGFRIDQNGKTVKGVPHRNPSDCHRFCSCDTCDSI